MSIKEVRFAIIIVHFKGLGDTLNCINSLKKLEYTNLNIILVDNSQSKEEEFDLALLAESNIYSTSDIFGNLCCTINIKDNSIRLTKIKSNNNGFAAANNLGIKFLKQQKYDYDWIWLLNNDTEVESDVLAKISNYITQIVEPNIGLIGLDIFNFYNRSNIQGIGGRFNYFTCTGSNLVPDIYVKESCELLFKNKCQYILGASLFVKAEFIDSVGLMDEDYFLYFEEIDWAVRGKKKGWELGYCFGAKVYHKEGLSINPNRNKSILADRCDIKNRVFFARKFLPKRVLMVKASLFYSFFKRLLNGKYSEAKYVLSVIMHH